MPKIEVTQLGDGRWEATCPDHPRVKAKGDSAWQAVKTLEDTLHPVQNVKDVAAAHESYMYSVGRMAAKALRSDDPDPDLPPLPVPIDPTGPPGPALGSDVPPPPPPGGDGTPTDTPPDVPPSTGGGPASAERQSGPTSRT